MSLPPLKKNTLPAVKSALPPVKSALPPVKSALPPVKSSPKKVDAPKKSLPALKSSPKKVVSPKKVDAPKKDQRQYLNTFFGTRNGIEGNPIEGVNYDQETLTYMTSRNRADEITQNIANKFDSPFQVWECCGGIGGNTLSFLDNPKVSQVTVFEKDESRRTMLKNNLKMYNLDNKTVVKDESFSGVTCNDTKQVLFFDPPWLPEGFKGQEAQKEDYLLSGIQINNKTLEEWAKESSCSLVAFKLPLGYQMKPVPGYRKEEKVLKNSLLILLTRKNDEYVKWSQGLKQFLRYDILPKIVRSEAALDKLVSPDAMKIWEVAFTNESFNPNVGENYEELELAGDVNLAAAYVKFMRASYPLITRSQLSEFRTKYLAKEFQSKLSASLGFGNHIRSHFRNNTHVLEDVLESFFGALDLIGDQEFKFGAGSGLVYNMVVELYKDVEVDWEVTLGNPKTRVKEFYEGMQWINPKPPVSEKVPTEMIENEDGSVTFSILVPQKGLDYLKSIGIALENNILVTSTENTKKYAEVIAYRLAVRRLEDLGLTDQFLAKFKRSKDLTTQELIPYIEAIKPRLAEEGYVEFYLTEHHVKARPGMKQKTAKYIQLIGVKDDGRKEVLSMTADPVEDVLEGKNFVLEMYATQ